MATVQTLIDRAARLLGQVPSGVSPTTQESADALTSLNDLVESWRNESLMCYARQEESLTLSASTSSYTIGPSGTLVTTRPVAIEAAYILSSSVSYPMEPMEDDEYEAIPDKTTTIDWPDKFLYRPTMPDGTVIVYPVPNATRTMKLLTRVPVTQFALVSTTISLPPGWQRALTYNLAVEIAPEYETSPRPEVVAIARESKAALKRMNSRPLLAHRDLAALTGRHSGNILTDQP